MLAVNSINKFAYLIRNKASRITKNFIYMIYNKIKINKS